MTFINTVEARSHKGSLALFRGDYKAAQRAFISVVGSAERQAKPTPKGVFSPESRPLPDVFPILYLPVEVAARELDARLLLAIKAAEVGYHVIIGQSWSFLGMWKELPPGVVLFKTLNTLDASNMEQAKDAGHVIGAVDEEGIGRPLSEDYFRMNLDPTAVSLCDRIFTQGTAHDDMIRTIYPGANTTVTGNPRAELFSDRYFLNHPEIHLFCSRAGNINPAGRSFLTCVQTTLKLAGGTSVKRMARLFKDSVRVEIDSLVQFIETAREVSKRYKVVVRPHPVEDPMFWHKVFRDDDIEVNASGSLRDWLKVTDTMYCLPECGTEHEAALAGVPCKVFGETMPAVRGLFEPGSACENIVNALLDVPLRQAVVPEAYLCQTRTNFIATPFHRRKFPETRLETITDKLKDLKAQAEIEANFKVTKVSDNQFYVRV